MGVPRGTQPEAGALAAAVSAEVRAAMARKRMSAKGLAEAAGLSPSYLSKRLRDEAALTINDLQAVCSVLGVDVLEMMTAAARKVS